MKSVYSQAPDGTVVLNVIPDYKKPAHNLFEPVNKAALDSIPTTTEGRPTDKEVLK